MGQGHDHLQGESLSAHDDAVRALIARAEQHTLGRSFLLEGAQDAVAATFGVHAFLVDAARDQLQRSTQG